VTLRIGTRGSALALAQAGTVAASLAAAGAPAELVVV
jgi:hydroxymethylbilane synthase